jgi:hypothetical protein
VQSLWRLLARHCRRDRKWLLQSKHLYQVWLPRSNGKKLHQGNQIPDPDQTRKQLLHPAGRASAIEQKEVILVRPVAGAFASSMVLFYTSWPRGNQPQVTSPNDSFRPTGTAIRHRKQVEITIFAFNMEFRRPQSFQSSVSLNAPAPNMSLSGSVSFHVELRPFEWPEPRGQDTHDRLRRGRQFRNRNNWQKRVGPADLPRLSALYPGPTARLANTLESRWHS